jgi:predicted peptidase
LSLLLLGTDLLGGQEETGFLGRTLVVDSSLYRYQVYVPPVYTRHRTLPVILYLHGADTGGSDGLLQTKGCLGSAVRANPDRWPFLIVFPQIPLNQRWMGRHMTAALRILDDAVEEFEADSSRVFITGFSLGATGSWYLAAEDPQRFAGVVPVDGRVLLAGRVNLPDDMSPQMATLILARDPVAQLAALLRRTPVWVYHGADDQVVPVDDARRMFQALRSLHAPVRYTEVPDGEHECATAYADPRLPKWLLAQPRTARPDQEPAPPQEPGHLPVEPWIGSDPGP